MSLLNMVMNDDTWYVVRNTRGVTGFVGPGSKPVPLTPEEMLPLGIKNEERVMIDLEVGDSVVVIGGAWKDTTGVIQNINKTKQSVTINVELFGPRNAGRNQFRRSEEGRVTGPWEEITRKYHIL